MPTQSKDPFKKYKLASRIELGAFLIIVISSEFNRGKILGNNPWLLFVVCLVLCMISGYIAILYKRLPKSKKHYNSSFFSEFAIHPYFTFGIFLIFSIACAIVALR